MKKYSDVLTILIYLILFSISLFIIKYFWIKDLFNSENFINADAEHYHTIMKHGYKGFTVGFFPLFPLIWRSLSTGIHGIVFINGIIFLISFYFIIKGLNIQKLIHIVFYLSIPSFIFFFLPFTEATFFLCSTLIISGLIKRKYILVYAGLFLAILTRPIFFVFIPALILTEIYGERSEKNYLRMLLYIAIAIMGIITVGYIQFLDTGEWFKFFSAQKLWGNELQIPKLPLSSWAGNLIVRLDGFAFLTGVMAGGFLIALILRIYGLKDKKVPEEVVFSVSYMAGITLYDLLYRGGSLHCMNRYLWATPFIIVAANYWIKQKFSFRNKQLLLIFGFLFIFWFLFGSYNHIMGILKYSLLSLYVLLIFTLKSDIQIIRRMSLFLFIVLNFIFQIFFSVRFLQGGWVG